MTSMRLFFRAWSRVRRVVALRRELAVEPVTIALPPELGHLVEADAFAEAASPDPELAELLASGTEDSLVDEIGVARVVTGVSVRADDGGG